MKTFLKVLKKSTFCVVSAIFLIGTSVMISEAGPINPFNITTIAPPPSVVEGSLEHNTTIYLFEESQSVLNNPLFVDITLPGTYGFGNTIPTANSGTIPAGTAIKSYFLHYDPTGQASPGLVIKGNITFTEQILGIMVYDSANGSTLDNSDFLGNPGTTYPTGATWRGLEFQQTNGDTLDWTAVSGDKTSLDLYVQGVGFDQLRIVTTPIPGALWLLGTGVVGLAAIRRRFK